MRLAILILALALIAPAVAAQTPADSAAPKPVVQVVSTAHLDTQWRWTVANSIDEYIPNTFRTNMALMDIYPDYVFSFEGAFRYMLFKEYYPEEYEKVKKYVASGQWRVCGSWVDAVDVNVPSFESLVRQTLYGNGFFKQEFGKTSRDIFLPDCFGFGYALPSIAHHCGLESFSTQKLTWGGWQGIPFDIGIWEGVDGSSIIAALNPKSYGSQITSDLSEDTLWYNTAMRQGEKSGLYAAYHYIGTGDVGGSPDSTTVDWLEKSIHSNGPLKVESVGADDIVDLVATVDRDRLPHYKGELVMTRHGVGCYSSEAAMKRWNRKNELLADAAERAGVIAQRLGGFDYPRETLRDTWIRFLWHQFHDDLTGTSIPEAYEYSWNDELLCLNRFGSVLEHAVETTIPALDTRVEGVPVVVYNPLSMERNDIVEVEAVFRSGAITARVFGPDGKEVAANVTVPQDGGLVTTIHFPARVGPVGYAVYQIESSNKPAKPSKTLKVTDRTLENERYRVKVNDAGDVASIFDKRSKIELLSAPLIFQFLTDTPKRWPAWEIDYDDIMAEPHSAFVGQPTISIAENGNARVALQVERKTANSTITTTIRLATGSEIVEFDNEIDWYERETLLKVAFPLALANDSVTYDIGLGTIKRGLNFDKRYEVPGQQWADMTGADGMYGVAVFNDCKYGWDHPTPNLLRLTLLHTPGVAEGWEWVGDEATQDQGHHQVKFAVMGHNGDWRDGDMIAQAARFNQPSRAFFTTKHDGPLGRLYSMLKVGTPEDVVSMGYAAHQPVMINALKMAEASDEIIVRVRETSGRPQNPVTITFDRPVLAAREVNGMEDEIGPATIEDGRLVFALTPYQPKAFAVTLDPLVDNPVPRPKYAAVELPFNVDGISWDDDRCDGDMDGHGNTLAGELLPDTIFYQGVPFVVGPSSAGALNMVQCKGQEVELPWGSYNTLYLLATSTYWPTRTNCEVDGEPYTLLLPDYAEKIGQWNNRLMNGVLVDKPEEIAAAWFNDRLVAWYGSHRHNPRCENETYRFTYLFAVPLDIPAGAQKLILPTDSHVRVVAATLVDPPYGPARPAEPLYDQFHGTYMTILPDSLAFAGQTKVNFKTPVFGTTIFYTLDGSEPTENSTPYTKTFTVNETTVIKALAVSDRYHDSYESQLRVTKMELHDAVQVANLVPGADCRYYEGEWEKLPDFTTLTPVSRFVADTVAIPNTARPEDYGLVFNGYVKVPADGVYAFGLNTDDGSRLVVADSVVIDNDGIHGDGEVNGLIGLKAGYHPFTVYMFQCKGGQALSVTIAGPSVKKTNLPASMLFHAKKK